MIYYRKGDALCPVIKGGIRVIPHVVNDSGKWGAGFTKGLSERWEEPERFYRARYKYAKTNAKLGAVQWVFVEATLAVVNMVAQQGVRAFGRPKPIRYKSLETCLECLAEGCRGLIGDGKEMAKKSVTVHMPRIGCGLAGGEWGVVGPLVEETLWDLDVYVYDLDD